MAEESIEFEELDKINSLFDLQKLSESTKEEAANKIMNYANELISMIEDDNFINGLVEGKSFEEFTNNDLILKSFEYNETRSRTLATSTVAEGNWKITNRIYDGLCKVNITSPLEDMGSNILYVVLAGVNLLQGDYYIKYNIDKNQSELNNILNGMLIITDKSSVIDDKVYTDKPKLEPIKLCLDLSTNETIEAYTIQLKDTGRGYNYLSLLDVLMAIENMRGSRLLLNSLFDELIEYEHKQKRHQKPYKVKAPNEIVMQNDAVMNALSMRGNNSLLPQDYFVHNIESGYPYELKTGKRGMKVLVYLQNDFSLDAAFNDYQISETDRFWYNYALNLALDGHTVQRTSELLKLAGYKNPYKEEAEEAHKSAAQAIEKFRRNEFALDVTEERKQYNKRGVDLAQAVELHPFIDCTPVYEAFVDGSVDYEYKLKAPFGGDIMDAFSSYKYAEDKNQIIRCTVEELNFKNVKYLTLEHRVMWSYILRRLKSQHMSNVIVLETMFRDIGVSLDDTKTAKRKRQRLISKLQDMLEEKRLSGLINNYKWDGTEKVNIILTQNTKKLKK